MSTAAFSPDLAPASPAPPRTIRILPVVAVVAAYWVVYAVTGALELDGFTRFLYRLGALAVALLTCLGWLLLHRGTSARDRLAIVAVVIATFVGTLWLRHASIHGALVMSIVTRSVEAMITGWALWLIVTRHSAAITRRRGLMAIAVLAWIWALTVRMDGLAGDASSAFFWRWTPSAEEKFLAEKKSAGKAAEAGAIADAAPLVATDADWTGFRGPQRDGIVHGVVVTADWNEAPPKQLWKRRVGPGWSSIVVVGDRIFTQEQREGDEAVVCFDAATGEPIWEHTDQVRFDEAMGGVGPRATPTFDGGRLYTLGATGILNCLDAATGKLVWTHDVKVDGQNATPTWGFCSSPLLVDGRVIVFAGGGVSSDAGEAEKEPSPIDPGGAPRPINHDTLVAYDAGTGDLAWRAPSGSHSYSSPLIAEFDGKRQIVFMSDSAVEAVDATTGKPLWSLPTNAKNSSPSIQPHLLGGAEFLTSFNSDAGLVRGHVDQAGDAWSADVEWVSKDLKPFFSDFVRLGDALYGFDGKLFCCVDAKTGKRHWKGGRYGSGQVVALADQPALLVITESGEVVLVSANLDKHEELGKFQAIEGKTWNHPVAVPGRLFVRNAEEMACFELK